MSAALNPGFSFDIASAALQAPWELTGGLVKCAALLHTACVCCCVQCRTVGHVLTCCWCSGLVAEARDDPASRHGSTADTKVQRRLAAMAAGPPGKSHREPAAPAQTLKKGVRARDTQTGSRHGKVLEGGGHVAGAFGISLRPAFDTCKPSQPADMQAPKRLAMVVM